MISPSVNNDWVYKNWLVSIVIGLAFATTGKSQDRQHEIESAVLQIVETINIPATAAGPISNINTRQGEMISQGQILATIDDMDVRLQLKEAQVELDIVKAQSESNVDVEFSMKSRQVALADYKRARESNRKYAGVVSDREMDRLKLLVEQSAAELEKIRFDKTLLRMQQKLKMVAVEKSNNELARHAIRSSVAGQLVDIKKHNGEWVNVADTIFRVVRLDKLRIEEYLPLDVATVDLLGAHASFVPLESQGSDGSQRNGKVVFVSPEVNPLNSTVLVWIEFENIDLQLRPGMKGTALIKWGHSTTQPTEKETVVDERN